MFKKKTNADVYIAPKPIVLNVSEDESDTDMSDSADADLLYERWINGQQLLISIDNKMIYDPDSFEHIATVIDDSTIDWHIGA